MDNKNNKAYLPYIDGLRAVSVLTILMFHLDITFFRGGFIGVDIFFVISGYLITRIITREIAAGTFSFANFYARRIRRIFPALFVMLFLTSFAAVVFLGAREFSEFFKALRFASGQVSNILFSREVDYFAAGNRNNPLLHTWSLGVEEQFYLLWPVMLIAVHKFLGLGRSLLVLGLLLVVSLAASEYLVRTNAMDAFYLLHSRAWELAMGGIVALNVIPHLTSQKWIETVSAFGLFLIMVAALFFNDTRFPGLKAVIPCLGAALFIYSAQQGQGWAHKLLSTPALVFIGLISYSLYLWHWPVIAFYKSYFGMHLTMPVQMGMAVLSFALAYLSYRLVEQPFRHAGKSPRKVTGVGLALVVTFIVTSNLVKDENEAGWRVTYKADKAVMKPHDLYEPCATEGGAYDKDRCIIGPHKDRYEVILVGDSHASHYVPTVLDWAEGEGLTVRIFLRGACQTWVESKDVKMKAGAVDTYCMDLTRAFYETLEKDKSIQYVFLGLMGMGDTPDIRHSLEKIKTYGKATYFLGRVPVFSDDPHQCQIKNHLLISKWFPRDNTNCLALDREYSDSMILPARDGFTPLLQELDIPYFDPLPFMDTAFDKEGHFLYMDSNHLNRYGGQYLAPYLRDFMDLESAVRAR